MNGSIRSAVLSDFEAIQLLDKSVTEGRIDRSELILRAIKEKRCYVSFSDVELQGFAIFLPHGFREMEFLELLVVDPRFRRHGIGSALLSHFTEEARTGVCWTSTNASNFPMIALLSRTGWIRSDHTEELDTGDPDIFFFIPIRK